METAIPAEKAEKEETANGLNQLALIGTESGLLPSLAAMNAATINHTSPKTWMATMTY